MPDQPRHISAMASYIENAYPNVEKLTGITFGQDYLWHIFNSADSDWYPHSLKPAIAMTIFKEYWPSQQVNFAADLQYSHHFEGRDLTDNEAYRHLLDKYMIPEDEFYDKLEGEEYLEKARYEISLVKQLKVTGFPTVFIQADETRFYMVARGFTPYETLKNNILTVLQSITSSSSSA